MVLNTEKKAYLVIREVLAGEANDVYICRETEGIGAPYKTVWIVKDRGIVRRLLENVDDYCEETFAQSERMGFVFPYFQERPLQKFYLGSIRKGSCSCQQVWLALVEQCMVSKLPSAVVYLILCQEQVHIMPDGSIRFGFQLDLSEYDDSICEKDIVIACADAVARLALLEDPDRKGDRVRLQAASLLTRKLERREYLELIQLYRDIRVLGRTDSAGKKWFGRYGASGWIWVYRLLSCVCAVLVCLAALVIAGRLFFGEAFFWKLSGSPLEVIGTESLLQ